MDNQFYLCHKKTEGVKSPVFLLIMGNVMVRLKRMKKTGWMLIAASLIFAAWILGSSLISDADEGETGETVSIVTADNLATVMASSDSTSPSRNEYKASVTEININGNAHFTANSFEGFTGLESITVSGDCTVESGAFSNCISLSDVNVIGSLTFSGDGVFSSDTVLTTITAASISAGSDSYITSSLSDCPIANIGIGGGSYTSPTGKEIVHGSTLVYVGGSVTSYTVTSDITDILANALSGTNISTLTFDSPNNITSIGTQGNWPPVSASGYTLTVNAYGGQDSKVSEYFESIKKSYPSAVEINYDSGGGPDVETYDVTLVHKYYDATGTTEEGSEAEVLTNCTVGQVISPSKTSYGGKEYTAANTSIGGSLTSYTVAAADADEDGNITVTFAYLASGGDTPTPTPDPVTNVTVTVTKTFYDINDKLLDKSFSSTDSYAVGSKITALEYAGFILTSGNSPYTVTADEASASVVFSYKATSADSKVPDTDGGSSDNKGGSSATTTKQYKVTVVDIFYNADKSQKIKTVTRLTDTYNENASYSYGPAAYDGYSCFDQESPSGTVTGNRTATFKYAATAASASGSEVVYTITEGANQTVTNEDGPIRIVCDGPMEKLRQILIDGADANTNSYTLESGSTILTLTHLYIKSFSEGEHTVRFVYTDGYAETKIIIDNNKKTGSTDTYTVNKDGTVTKGHSQDATPKTADGFDTRYLLCLAIFLLGLGFILFSKQKNIAFAGDDDQE